MIVKNLKLHNFRNLENTVLTFSAKNNFIYGKNGSGKSNLIESIYLFFKGKSFRKARLKDTINWKKDYMRLEIKTNFEINNDLYLYYDKKKI